MQTQIETHPVQNNHPNGAFAGIRIPKAVTMRAYEVYCHVYGPQEAMIDDEGRGCRGGFDILNRDCAVPVCPVLSERRMAPARG